MATYSAQYEVTQYLLAAGADVNAQDTAGNTALMGVCFKGHTALAELLIAHGADVNIKNKTGGTALSFAKQFGQVEMAKTLAANGAV